MNLLDIIILIPLVWLGFRGMTRGLVYELLSLAAWLLGVFAGIYFSDYASVFLVKNLNLNNHNLGIASFLVTFFTVFIVIMIIEKILSGLIDLTPAGFINKLAGAVFGVTKAIFLVSLLFYGLSRISPRMLSEEKKEGSMFYKYVSKVAPYTIYKVKKSGWMDIKSDKDEEKEIVNR